MADRPLSERERETLVFLLSSPEMPNGDVLRRRAEVVITSGRTCPCGCASIDLKLDRSAAVQARAEAVAAAASNAPRDHRTYRVDAFTEDIAGVHKREPLVFWNWKEGRFDPAVVPTEDDFEGYIGLMLWVRGASLLEIEIHSVGNFRNPRTFPPAEFFDAPSVTPA
jgi:hypothetical protein